MNNFSRTLILTCVLAVSGVAQKAGDAERDLEAAINREVVQGDLNGAIGLYRNILTRYGSQRQIGALALLHLAQCQEKLGQAAEARKSYQRVVNEFADRKDVAALAQSRLAQSGETAVHSGAGVRMRRVPSKESKLASYHDGGIYLRNASTGKETLLVQSPTGRAYSLDDKWVAYRTAQGAVWLAAADGSSRRQIKGPATRRPGQLCFTDDSSGLSVIYFYQGEEIWLYPVQGGEGRKLYESSQAYKDIDYPVFSRDGRLAAYGAEVAGSTVKNVLVVPTTGGESWKVQIQAEETAVGFTAEGQLVVYSGERFGSPSLWTRNIEQGHTEEEKPELLQRVPAKGAGEYRNGEYYYWMNGKTRHMLSVSLDAAPPLPFTDMGLGVSPAYSEDGRFLAWGSPDDNGRLIVRDLETGTEKRYDTPLRELRWVRWYADGSGLLAIGYAQTQPVAGVKVDLASGAISPVKFPRFSVPNPSLNPTLSRDGRYIYYKRQYHLNSDKGLLQRYDLNNNAEERVYAVPEGVMLRLFSISPDGLQIAMVFSDKEGRTASNWIEVAPLASGETKRIYQTGPGEEVRDFYGLTWAADGKSVFFLTHADSNEGETLWRVSLDGSPAQRLLKKTGNLASLSYNERPVSMAVRPDGREIILGLTEGGWERWVMEGLK